MLNYCVPELDLNLVTNPVICDDCIHLIEVAFKFRTKCLKNEERLLKYSYSTSSKQIDLNNFYKNIRSPTRKEVTTVNNNNDKVTENVYFVRVEDIKCTDSIVTNVPVRNSNRSCFDCEKCHGCENNLNDPSYHSKQYTGPFICYNCGKQVDDIFNMRKHIMKHRKQRKCKVCQKSFRDLNCLNKHLRSHTGSKPFACTLCSKSFQEKYKLDQHIKQHNGDKTVMCKICKKVLSTTYNLKIHMKQHTGDKTVMCKICKKVLSTPSNLKVHMKQHVKKKKCELCGQIFISNMDLIQHLETNSETCGNFVYGEIKPENLNQELANIKPELIENDCLEHIKEEMKDEITELHVPN
ncbi:hypothetical protein NQ317_006279 [Molorchus minor]|uniref:C2H2-type domain-containing protein n=1 Tax=Molorchus minor TaxID=1323400 RepID=A0ABQ9J5J4_9CUCU|nr:hypothetical protein NQ317_006279 [Molorchus minor]